MTTRQALGNFAFWVGVAALVNLGILWQWGAQPAAEFAGAFVLEKVLSLDNLFMFYFIFSAFATPQEARPRVLRWGMLGVILMRGAIILAGTSLISQFHWLLYGFALFLLWASYKIIFGKEDDQSEEERIESLRQNWLVKIAKRYFDFDDKYHGEKFFAAGKPTLLLLVLIVVEGTDVPFAFDSLPAAMAISTNFWIVLSSNLLAVMGLRAIYFLIENMQERFAYMKVGIGILLGIAAIKILLPIVDIHVPLGWSLGIIVAVICSTIGYTLLRTRNQSQSALSSAA